VYALFVDNREVEHGQHAQVRREDEINMAAGKAQQIEQEFIDRHPGSAAFYQRAVAAIPRGVTHDVRYMRPFPLYMTRASGSKKWDVDGNQIIDYAMGHGALILGHGHPGILEAVTEQLQRGTHYGAGHELEVEWGERIHNLIPSAEQVEFTSSGTEATMLAMRIARAFSGKEKIMKFAGHFHGWHDYALPGEQNVHTAVPPYGVPKAVLDTVVVAPVNDLEFVDRRLADGDIAAVILEPSGASYATIPFPDGFLKQLREITQKHNTILIFDEVITGFRWSPGGKQVSEGVIPDMTTMAKIVAGGLPGGAIGGRADIMSVLDFRDDPAWRRIAHPGTYNANPLSAAAGAACLGLVADPGVQQHADRIAATIRAGFNDVIVRHDVPGFVWGESSVFHVMLGLPCENQTGGDIHIPAGVDPQQLKSGMAPAIGHSLHLGMLNRGVDFFHGGGLLSAAHSNDDTEKTVTAFEETVAQMKDAGLFNAD
jgi:glutamate-1-semialdehyde 2,1-aminomutase